MSDRYDDLRSVLPPSYIRFIETHNGWEGDLGKDFGFLIVWDRQSVQDRWLNYKMADYLSGRWFPFGSDGGGEMLCFDLVSRTDRVFVIPYVGMSDDAALPLFGSFADLVAAIEEVA